MPKSNQPLPAASAAEHAGDAVIATLHQAGHAAFRVGGCVRDRLLGRPVQEVDVATAAGHPAPTCYHLGADVHARLAGLAAGFDRVILD
ncbi:MAG: hypothetical protein WCH61_09600, partial [bacterium]